MGTLGTLEDSTDIPQFDGLALRQLITDGMGAQGGSYLDQAITASGNADGMAGQAALKVMEDKFLSTHRLVALGYVATPACCLLCVCPPFLHEHRPCRPLGAQSPDPAPIPPRPVPVPPAAALLLLLLLLLLLPLPRNQPLTAS